MKDFVAIDFETANQHRSSVCSVGIVVVREGVIVEKIYRLIKPSPNFYSFWNTRCHGLCYQDTVRAGEFPQVWAEIAPRIKGLPLVAHNKSFDEQCLRKCYEAFGMQYPEYVFFCTLTASRRHFPNLANHQLHTVSAYVGFELTNHHHALADSEACAAIALQIL